MLIFYKKIFFVTLFNVIINSLNILLQDRVTQIHLRKEHQIQSRGHSQSLRRDGNVKPKTLQLFTAHHMSTITDRCIRTEVCLQTEGEPTEYSVFISSVSSQAISIYRFIPTFILTKTPTFIPHYKLNYVLFNILIIDKSLPFTKVVRYTLIGIMSILQ